jgi:hypothetical protein
METTQNKRGTRGISTKAATTKSLSTDKNIYEYMSKSGGSVHMLIQSGITVYDKESNAVREIRYCENENSIFKDEQSSSSVKTPIVFRMGRIFVHENKPNLKRYLDLHPGNEANGGTVFYLVDNEADAEKEIQNEFLSVDAISMVRDKPLEELMSVAMAFNVSTDRKVAEIKHDLLQIAKSNPKKFIDSFDNPVVSMKAKVKQAKSMQIIKADSDAVRWFDSDKVIISVPVGQDPIDVMVRYCLTEQAAVLVSEIDRQLGA